MAFSQRRQLTRQTWSIVKKAGIALLAAQAAAVVTVHAIDRMRTARIPGGVHGFPTLPPADTQIGNTVARTYTEGTSLYADMLEAIEGATHHIYFETFIWRSDRWGQRFKDALIAAAERGVVLIAKDYMHMAIHAMEIPPAYEQPLADAFAQTHENASWILREIDRATPDPAQLHWDI